MSARASLTALDGVTTADGVSVATRSGADGPGVGPGGDVDGDPVAGRVLPTWAELAAVLPWPGLRRGSTVAVTGSVALLFALLAEATSNGSWAAVVGLPGIGLAAAVETGVAVSRLALVPQPGNDAAGVAAALIDGVDLVVVAGTKQVSEQDARRLSARARHRGAVLLAFGDWPGVDVSLECAEARWRGLGQGHGYLREREVTVRASGRGAAARPRSCRVLLPGRDGALGVVESNPPENKPHESNPEGRRASLRPVAG